MKITKLILHQPAGLLRLVIDEGLEGHCTGVTASAVDVDVDLAAPILVGTNPLDRERTWWTMRDLDEGPPPAFRAGIDVALWDLSAKIVGRPLFRHLGGFRDRVPVCRVGIGGDTSSTAGTSAPEIAKEAKDAQRAGFKAYRFGVMADENALVHLVREVRAAVGPDFPLILDGRARFVVDEAIRIGKALDDEDYFYFDRPRPRNDHTGGKQVADEIDTPTSAEVCSPIEASQVMTLQSADHIRTGVCGAGGITDVLKSARCAEAFGAYCHLDGAGISDGFAHIHLAGAIRNMPFLEMTGHEVAPPFVLNPVQIEDGLVPLPDLPGLGMEIDLDAVMDLTSEMIEA
ncbi:MAG: hypothetical protein F4Y38_05425 [Gemmatimonadetes bacterium]|nr:hypothetical protein [Gemmatimonadota bacterium]MYG85300.1 hypothetical protein [Gemmatimonadota bacterium]MYJ88967.1 hypothetical protein [Gemmatimonadota bacterium]